MVPPINRSLNWPLMWGLRIWAWFEKRKPGGRAGLSQHLKKAPKVVEKCGWFGKAPAFGDRDVWGD